MGQPKQFDSSHPPLCSIAALPGAGMASAWAILDQATRCVMRAVFILDQFVPDRRLITVSQA